MSVGQPLFSLFIVLVLLSTSSLMAQGQEIKQNLKGTRSLEVFAGPSLVYNHGSEEYEEFGKVKVGYLFGLNVRHYLGNKFAVSTSFGFYRKGFKQEDKVLRPPDIYNNPPTNNQPPEEVKLKGNLSNDYFILHVLPEYHWIHGKLTTSVGFYFAKLLKSQITREEILRGQVVRKVSGDRIDSYEEYDYGALFLIGYSFKMFSPGDLQLSVSLDYGIPNYQIIDHIGIRPRKNLSYNFKLSFKII